MLGFYCETVQKLRYKGFYQPTELLDRYTMNYVYLKDVQNLIKDGKNHKLCDKPNNPNYKYIKKEDIPNYINDLIITFKEHREDIYLYFIDFVYNYVAKKYINIVIEEVKRFLEIVPLDLLDKIKFIAKFKD